MIRMILCLLILSCASSRDNALPAGATVAMKTHGSAKEARSFVRNKWNYLFLLFEQSHDPYYGTPKWSPECLERNTFGKVEETNGNVFFLSRLLLNSKKEPGFCAGEDTEVIHLHCADELVTHEIHCPPGSCERFIKKNPCPLNK